MNEVITIGLDLAKSVFQVHGVDASGKPIIRRQLRRRQVLAFFKKLPPCLVGMEACATSHYWAREIAALGHEVRMMPARYVKPYVKRNKSDAADAEAICEAARSAGRRPAPDQALCSDQDARAAGGPDAAPDPAAVRAPAHGDDQCAPGPSRRVRDRRWGGPQRAREAPGGDRRRAGRDFSAWIGLVPREDSTGGKHRPGHISKAGDRYLQRLLVIGALSVIKRGPTRWPASPRPS